MHAQEPFLILPATEVFAHQDEWKIFPDMARVASCTFLALEKAWQLEAATLVDLKVEFGFDSKGRLLLSDVIDNDSWRVIENGSYIDKQVYRDGGALDDVAVKYRFVAEATSRFRLPRQRIILWRGSETDKADAFSQALGSQALGSHGLGSDGHAEGFGDLKDLMTVVTCSVHKEPASAASILHRMAQEIPDSVVIAYIGRSNGAGPTLSAMSTIPVITVPASVKEFPDDVWSSLRAPSKVPVMTVLEPANAILAAMQILSARNPRLYALLRLEIETRALNTMAI
jgi:phosphoribosylaminoimidazole carboxylase PurE protein